MEHTAAIIAVRDFEDKAECDGEEDEIEVPMLDGEGDEDRLDAGGVATDVDELLPELADSMLVPNDGSCEFTTLLSTLRIRREIRHKH